MSNEELIVRIQNTVKETIKTELGADKVDKEQHYQDHLWLKELRIWFQDMQRSFWKSLVGLVLLALLTLLVLGFLVWAKTPILGGK